MRLDASGNFMVGKTAVDGTSTGHVLRAADSAIFTRVTSNSGGESVQAGRGNTNGRIVRYNKNGGAIGYIGVESDDLAIHGAASGHKGLRFGNGAIVPVTNVAGQDNGNCNLGGTTSQFNNLYLSGGVVFGPASGSDVSSQTLDSYEEGTFEPSVSVGSVTTAIGHYTKIGRQVHFDMRLTGGFNITNNETQFFGNLPFTPSVTNVAVGSAMMNQSDASNRFGTAYLSSQIALYSGSQTGGFDNFRCTDLSSASAVIYIQGTYYTNS